MRLTTALALILSAIVLRAMPAAAADCDRACLRGIVTQYLEAFVAHTPSAAFASTFKYIEDAIDTKPGDGLWKEATKLRPYRVDVLDARLGVAGTMTLVDVNGGPAMVATVKSRLMIVVRTPSGSLIAEICTERPISSPSRLNSK